MHNRVDASGNAGELYKFSRAEKGEGEGEKGVCCAALYITVCIAQDLSAAGLSNNLANFTGESPRFYLGGRVTLINCPSRKIGHRGRTDFRSSVARKNPRVSLVRRLRGGEETEGNVGGTAGSDVDEWAITVARLG